MLPQFEETKTGLLVRAPAKINLSLLITGKRPDGYHGIETVMAKINLMDEILIEPGTTPGIEFACTGKYAVPCDESNLVYRAAKALCEHVNQDISVNITLTKNIPVGSGLGGGSSDAASVLLAINRFFSLKQSIGTLGEIAAQLGSDINFFLGGPLALCSGRGEKVDGISSKFDFQAILLLPSISVSTKKVYENYLHNQDMYLQQSRLVEDLIQKKAFTELAESGVNMLEGSCFRLNKPLAELRVEAESLLPGRVCLSGSGSAMYCCLTTGGSEAERFQSGFRNVSAVIV